MVDAVLLLRELCHRQLVGAGLSQDFDYLGIEISPDKPGPKLGYNVIGRGYKTVVGPRFNPVSPSLRSITLAINATAVRIRLGVVRDFLNVPFRFIWTCRLGRKNGRAHKMVARQSCEPPPSMIHGFFNINSWPDAFWLPDGINQFERRLARRRTEIG